MSDESKQGELYKLLWPAYESETYNDETRKRASDELNKVLDAARADFPKEADFYNNPQMMQGKFDYDGFCDAVKNWCIKWLGAP